MPSSLALLGYGPVGELCLAVEACRRSAREERTRRQVTLATPLPSRQEMAAFERYARMLAIRYPYHGSGADGSDVEQVAMLAALQAVQLYKPGAMSFVGFVKSRMRWRVIDFVRLRGEGQRVLERGTVPLDESGRLGRLR